MSKLLIDFESTGVDTKTARITEIGAMITTDNWTEVTGISELVWQSGYPALTPEVVKVTHITQQMLNEQGISMVAAMALLCTLVEEFKPTHVVAYNKAYDEALFRAELVRQPELMDIPYMKELAALPWVCAMSDIEKNYEFKSWRLMHVALEHGVTVNPTILHRAIADVELMRQMLVNSGETADTMYTFQKIPWVYVEAIVKKPWDDGGESTDLAKKHGYSWERARGDDTQRSFSKKWIKRIKEKNYEQELALPFQVRRL